MPARSNDFQKLIFLIEQQLDGKATVRESAMLPDRSGGESECDVLIERLEGTRVIRIALECRDHKRRKGDKTWIEQIHGKYSTLQVDERIAVSRSGFTSGAKQKAAHLGIKTMSFAAAAKFEWAAKINEVARVQISQRKMTILQVDMYFSHDESRGRITTRPDLCSITDTTGQGGRLDHWINTQINEIRSALDAAATKHEKGWVRLDAHVPGWSLVDELGVRHELILCSALLRRDEENSVVDVTHGTYGDAAFLQGSGRIGEGIVRVVSAQAPGGSDDPPIHIRYELLSKPRKPRAKR